MITLIRVAYGKRDTPKEFREYQENGVGPVGTISEWKENYPSEEFEIIDRTQPLRKDEVITEAGVKRALKMAYKARASPKLQKLLRYIKDKYNITDDEEAWKIMGKAADYDIAGIQDAKVAIDYVMKEEMKK